MRKYRRRAIGFTYIGFRCIKTVRLCYFMHFIYGSLPILPSERPCRSQTIRFRRITDGTIDMKVFLHLCLNGLWNPLPYTEITRQNIIKR